MEINPLERLKKLIVDGKPIDIALNDLANELQKDLSEIINMIQQAVESYIKVKFNEAIIDEIQKHQPPLDKINVTDLTFPCLRRSYYSKVYKDLRLAKLGNMLSIWIGLKLHETPLAKFHELELEYEGIYGRVDGYEDGIIFELKTTRFPPSTPYSHHVKQVEYYRVLLERNGYPVKFAIIVYVDLKTPALKPFLVMFDRSLKEIEEEMLTRKNMLLEHLKKGIPPPPEPSEPWACDYCEFAWICGYDSKARSKKKG